MFSTKSEITQNLFNLQDIAYRDFQAKLIPTVAPETVIGVRTPVLRAFAKQLRKNAASDKETASAVKDFLSELPHKYYDENQLHAFILSQDNDYDSCILGLENFLPYVDNWATCDTLIPKVLKKQKYHENVLVKINDWIQSSHTYTVRYAIGTLMRFFLDDEFNSEYLEKVAAVQSDEYYIKMMVAWYFATALAKQWDATLPFIKEKRLEVWTHNKTIQKAIESYRITPEQKDLLRGLKL